MLYNGQSKWPSRPERNVTNMLTERNRKKARRLAALLAACLAAAALSGCNAGANDPGDTSANMDAHGQAETPPDGFVDNSADLSEYSDEEIYFTDPEKSAIIGVNDEQVYFNGAGFQSRFAVNMIIDGPEGSAGLPVDAIRDRVDRIQFGDFEYSVEDLVRPRTEGFAVLEKMAADFGIDVYGVDENDTVVLKECMGKELSGDALREAYSERADFEDYTVCVYYLHARMSGMAKADYDACRKTLEDRYGIDHSSLLDGTLAVMLYYDTTGHDLFYTIAASAPGYWSSPDDFADNLDNGLRHDITKCHMMMDGDHPVGFVNQVFIRCDRDPGGAGTDEPQDGGSGQGAADGPESTTGGGDAGTEDGQASEAMDGPGSGEAAGD